MNEVATKVFGMIWKALEKRNVSAEEVCAEAGVSIGTRERIDWEEHNRIMRVVRSHFSEDELIAIGRSYLHSKGLRFAMVIARLAMSPMDFYRWFSKPRDGVGNQMFSCITPSHRELAPFDIELDLILPEGFEVSEEFLLISVGNMSEMPVLLGYPPAEVTLTRLPNGGRLHILVPQGTAIIRRVLRFLKRPFVRRDAAKELRSAHESLLEKYEQLESAQAKLDRQAAQLRTAHTINRLAQRDLDLKLALDTLTQAMVTEAGFASASIKLVDRPEGAHAGPPTERAPIVRPLVARAGQTIGELTVGTVDATNRDELLELITPTLSIAIENAVYRTGLEQLVEQRTAELTVARDQLAGTVEQLKEAQGARERFFGNISHEIRTPLSLIMLAAGDIQSRAGSALDGRASQSLTSVTDGARKLVRLVDELLLLAAGQENKLKVHREPTDVAALVNQLGGAWRPAAEAAGLELEVVAPTSMVVSVDPVAMERVASNLMSNAVKYTPRGGRVTLELAEDPGEFRLSVLDTGAGIDADLAARLFGRFERGAKDRGKIGTGIGLSLVKQLVEAHEGTIAVVARDGGGTEMRVVIPRSEVREQAAPMRGLRLEVAAPSGGIANGQRFDPPGISAGIIVVAEDDVRLAEATARLLSERYTVIVGLDGELALELVKKHQPQLLVTDVEMPNMNGIELAKRFREHTGDRLAPIIILSAVIDLGTRVAGLEAGAVDYVTKPFDPRELMARVDAQFRMRELAVRLHQAEQLSTLGILTSGLAHEIRNPANGIVNAIAPLLELLPKELVGPETGPGQLFEVMTECAEQINFLSRQLLGFRRNQDLELAPAELTELVKRAIHLAQNALLGVEVRTSYTVDKPIYCSGPLLVQALTNLIENAGHAVGKGGWVHISTLYAGSRVLIEVTDSGAGVPVALRDRIFEPFFTTKAPGVGTGLGLAVSRSIVERHRGLLEIREHHGRPAFVIDLPGLAESTPKHQRIRYDSRAPYGVGVE